MKMRWWMAPCALLAIVAIGCSDGDGDNGSKDDTNDAAAVDAGGETVGGETVGGDTGASADTGGPDCGAEKSCLDKKGKNDLALCPSPIDYTCEAGCCKKIEKCKADADCADKLGTDVCPDKRFGCGCADDGTCVQRICASDADCTGGKVCNNGGCHDAPKATDVSAHLLRPFWIARPKDSVDAIAGLGAQARTKDGITLLDAKFKWELKGKGFKLDGGKIVATDEAGAATITATVEGGTAKSNPANLWNLGPMPAKADIRVAVASEGSLAPLAGKVVAVGMADQATPAAAITATLKDGVATFEGVKFPADVHVLATDHEPVSVLRIAAKADIVVPTRPYFHADLQYDGAGKMLKEAELVGGDVVTGEVKYAGQGEAGLGITSLGVGGDLLSFNIDALVGPSVKRPFNDKAPSLVNPEPGKPQDIPGGVTFLLKYPVVDGYVLAASPGKRILWSLAGRVPLSDLGPAISQIVGAVDGGLDVGKVVSTLLPYLASFYSQVVMDTEFKGKLSDPANKQDLAPDMPLGLSAKIVPPALPEVKKGVWADLILSVSGAMMPDGQFVPLGLTAAPDAVDGAKPDGKVDGDPAEDGDQDMNITSAPLHSGLRVGKKNNFALVHAAINVGGDGKKEGGSIIIGDVGDLPKEDKPGAFLGYSATSKYDKAKRTLTVDKVTGAHFYRVILTGSKSRRWLVVVPTEAAGKALSVADITKYGAAEDLGKSPKRVFVGAFELRKKADTAAILGPAGLTDLVRQVKRTSFIDVSE